VKASRRAVSRTAVKILVSLGVLTVLITVLPWDELWGALRRLSVGVWFGVFGGFVVGHLLGVIKWRRMLYAGRAALTLTDAIRCYAAGLFANLCLPSIVGGDVLRAVLAGKTTGRPEAVVIGSVGDRLCDMASLALLAAVGAFFARASLPGWGANVVGVLLVVGVATLVLFLPLIARRPIDRWPAPFRRPVGRTLVALRRLARAPGVTATVIGISLTIQTGFVLLNGWIGGTVGIDLPIAAWFFAWPLAKVVGLLPISLGGLGVRDAALGVAIGSFGYPVASGVAVSLIWQSVLIAAGLLAGLTWFLLGRRTAEPAGSPFDILARSEVPNHG
jgi:uncharacterized membrane protein YbhN (UPF0104 family)